MTLSFDPYVGVDVALPSTECSSDFHPHYQLYYGMEAQIVLQEFVVPKPGNDLKFGSKFGLPYTRRFEIIEKTPASCALCSGCITFDVPISVVNYLISDWLATSGRKRDVSECSAPCDGGTRERTISCVDQLTSAVLDPSVCSGAGLPTPVTIEACNTHPCDPCEAQVSCAECQEADDQCGWVAMNATCIFVATNETRPSPVDVYFDSCSAPEPQITLLTPEGNSTYDAANDVVNITWTGGLSTVILRFQIDEDSLPQSGAGIPEMEIPNTGSFEWRLEVSLTSSANYQVTVVSGSDETNLAKSDAFILNGLILTYEWVNSTEPFSTCLQWCGGDTVVRPEATCQTQFGLEVLDSLCNALDKPPNSVSCGDPTCTPTCLLAANIPRGCVCREVAVGRELCQWVKKSFFHSLFPLIHILPVRCWHVEDVSASLWGAVGCRLWVLRLPVLRRVRTLRCLPGGRPWILWQAR